MTEYMEAWHQLKEAEPDMCEHVTTAYSWLKDRGFPAKKADLSIPAVFFSPTMWGLWALIVTQGDPQAVGSRIAPGWVTDLFRRLFREHIVLLAPKTNLRSIEREEDVLIACFVELASGHIDGWLAFRSPAEILQRLAAKAGETKDAILALIKPLVRRVAGSKDPFDKEEWKAAKSVIFGRRQRSPSASSSETEDDVIDSSVRDQPAQISWPSDGATQKAIKSLKSPPDGSKASDKTRPNKKRRDRKKRRSERDAEGRGFAAFDVDANAVVDPTPNPPPEGANPAGGGGNPGTVGAGAGDGGAGAGAGNVPPLDPIFGGGDTGGGPAPAATRRGRGHQKGRGRGAGDGVRGRGASDGGRGRRTANQGRGRGATAGGQGRGQPWVTHQDGPSAAARKKHSRNQPMRRGSRH